MPLTESIAAIITAPGRAAISVIRVSGDDAIGLVAPLFESSSDLLSAPTHSVHYGWIRKPEEKTRIDEVLVLLMRAPRSYTGEDVVEIQCHGGSVAAAEILGLLLRAGARLAEAGEFTRRAFLNGKTDLTRAEAIMDMVEAESEEALAVAAQQKAGDLEARIRAMRETLMTLIAYIQADLDYPEDDIERLTPDDYQARVADIECDLADLLSGARRGQLYREGLKVVIAGKPNVGKSSLLNALTGRKRAIVTDIPGTTRDVVRDHISIDGLPIEILDTAGLRVTDDAVEAIGVNLAREALEEADLILQVRDARERDDRDDDARSFEIPESIPILRVYNKSDLVEDIDPQAYDGALLSAKTGEGLDTLSQAIFDRLLASKPGGKRPLVSNRRHIALLEKTQDALSQFQDALAQGLSFDLLVIDLQVAWETLGLITGQTAEDDLLNEIFSRFCLGK